jgi:hypothetical protein
MIKIKLSLKQNKKLIKEEYKYSTFNAKEIYKYLIDYRDKGHKNISFDIYTPIEDLTYSDKQNRLRGMPFFYYANVLGKEFKSASLLKSNWITSEKRFKDDFIEKIKNKFVKTKIVIDYSKPDNDLAGAFFAEQNGLITKFKIIYYVNNMTEESYEDIIVHELKHTTHAADSLMLSYGETIYKTNNIDEMFPIPIRLETEDEMEDIYVPKLTGVGKRTTLQNDDPVYHRRPEEFETNLPRIANSIFSALIEQKDFNNEIHNNVINTSNLAGKFLYKILNNKKYRNAIYLDSQTEKFIDILYNEPQRQKEFTNKVYKLLITNIDNYRKKYFDSKK